MTTAFRLCWYQYPGKFSKHTSLTSKVIHWYRGCVVFGNWKCVTSPFMVSYNSHKYSRRYKHYTKNRHLTVHNGLVLMNWLHFYSRNGNNPIVTNYVRINMISYSLLLNQQYYDKLQMLLRWWLELLHWCSTCIAAKFNSLWLESRYVTA